MIITRNIGKTYKTGTLEYTALRDVSFEVADGEFVAIMGQSGAGKSTLLYQLSLLDRPTSGEIFIDNTRVDTMSSKQRSRFRLHRLGYIFQDYAILPELTAQENVAAPLLMQGISKRVAFKRAAEALDSMGLGERLRNVPGQLSGGEQQRVAIARAIVNEPDILFADEPTASLDSTTSEVILDIFLKLNQAGQTIVMITHELEYGTMAQRIIELKDGMIVSDKPSPARKVRKKSPNKSKRSSVKK